jgi:hypothetical protein
VSLAIFIVQEGLIYVNQVSGSSLDISPITPDFAPVHPCSPRLEALQVDSKKEEGDFYPRNPQWVAPPAWKTKLALVPILDSITMVREWDMLAGLDNPGTQDLRMQ